MATQQQKFSFPLLKPPDILQCLYELEIRMSEEELNQCDKHRESVRRVFEQLMEMCIGVTKEELAQPAFAGLQSLNYPELHEDSVSELAHFRAIHRMMEACGVHDFSVMDMLAPNHKRLKRQLSAVINFAKFREEQVAKYEATQGESVAMEQRYRAAQRKNAELKAQIARLERAKDSEKESEEETKAAVAALRLELADAKKRAASAATKKAEAADSLDAVRAEAAKSSAELASAEAERAELEAKIVHVDPERTATLKALTQKCAEAQRALDEATAETRETEARAVGAKELARDIAKTTEYMEEVVEAHRKKKEASTKLKEAKKKHGAMEERQYEIEAKVETLKRQEANCAEKLNRLKSQGELKRHAAEASLKAAKEELEAVKARREANTARNAEENHFQTPIDEVDAAARVLHPVFDGLATGAPLFGVFLKDYAESEW